uniref:Uncharacterized protein n=1 Tax=Glossina pallidipes TaxID=7398 RepID=A0A1A9ZK59_GLOPL
MEDVNMTLNFVDIVMIAFRKSVNVKSQNIEEYDLPLHAESDKQESYVARSEATKNPGFTTPECRRTKHILSTVQQFNKQAVDVLNLYMIMWKVKCDFTSNMLLKKSQHISNDNTKSNTYNSFMKKDMEITTLLIIDYLLSLVHLEDDLIVSNATYATARDADLLDLTN